MSFWPHCPQFTLDCFVAAGSACPLLPFISFPNFGMFKLLEELKEIDSSISPFP